jgi:hypothetical protein
VLTKKQIAELLSALAAIRTVVAFSSQRTRNKCLTPEKLWKTLCAYGIHDYEFVVINQKGALLRCFYCGHEKISTKMWMQTKKEGS